MAEYNLRSAHVSCPSKSAKQSKSPLILTGKGNEVGKKIVDKISGVLDTISGGLTEEERVVFYRSLSIISESLDVVSKNGEKGKGINMKFKMVHENYNVTDLDKSIAFYEKALGLHETRRINGNGFIIVYMGNEESSFELELTWIEEHPQAYNLGECEFHLAFEVDDYEVAHKLHEEMGCICYENPAMGIYFITDPDGYWLEIVPSKNR